MKGAHPYRGVTASLATKHEKEKVVAPSFARLDIALHIPAVDTDELGTFSGEIPRIGTPREVVLKKARMGMKVSGLPYGIASEGSIGPDLIVPFINSDIECIAWVDDELGIEIVEFHRSLDIVAVTSEVLSEEFLTRAGFPEHSLIVKGQGSVVKGINNRLQLEKVIAELGPTIVIESDVRAHHSPSRRRNIAAVAEKLVARLSNLCGDCKCPGFGAVENIYGLPCSECGTLNERAVRGEVHGCAKCENRIEAAGKRISIEPAECLACNP